MSDNILIGIIIIGFIIVYIVQIHFMHKTEIDTLWKEKTQMMEVLVNNGLARYIIDPVDGKTASITYLLKDNQK